MDGVLSLGEIQQTFGVLFDGFVLSMIGYGFTFFQTYMYFGEYPSDHWMQKSFVAILFSLDTASAALVSRNIWVAGIAIFLAVAGFALGIAMVVMTFKQPVFAHLAATSLRVVFSLACTMVVLASLSIFIGFIHFSRKPSSSRPSSALEWFDNISQYVLARGLLVVIVQLGCLVTFVALPHEMYWIPVYSVATKTTINALLYMLNSRQAHRGKGVNEEGSVAGFRPRAGLNSSNAARLPMVFKSVPEDFSTTIEITRTVEFDRKITAGDDFDKSLDSSDPTYRNDFFRAVGTDDVKPILNLQA
ncbi:hypothetical protein B0H19DRAFT_1375337 [Mycena capillaripes]|nr:hypothetical protein B0H19DRAFT_1375337 [Mycena capillaripes]